MANPRNVLDFTDIDAHYTTFAYDAAIVYDATKVGGAAQVGLAVTLVGNADRTVSTVADGERVLGKLIKVESDGFCTVQDEGYMTLPAGTAATLTIGSTFAGAVLVAAEGYIKTLTTAGIGRGEIIDNDDLANVIVRIT